MVPPRDRRVKWEGRLLPLMARPFEWVRVHPVKNYAQARQVVYRLRRGHIARPPGVWDFRHAEVEGRWWVFAQFQGASR